jgi:hypothetical protein
METLQNIALWVFQNLLWNILMAALGAIAATAVVRKGLGYLKSLQNVIWFAGGSFALILAVSFIANQRTQNYPRLQGNIEAVYTAQALPVRALVIIETITNSGSMPSVAYLFRVTLKHGAQSIECPTATVPDQFSIAVEAKGSFPQRTVTYHGKDSLLIKALSPIPPGGAVSGIITCELKDFDISNLREDDEVTVSFLDVFRETYVASLRGTSKLSDVVNFPGLTQEIK